ncbi:MAG TPA: hypothetical protein VF755_13720, partial [Catenuloplanes sp.]
MSTVTALGRAITRLGSASSLLALTVGVPYALTVYIGWPLPRTVPTTWADVQQVLTTDVTDTLVVNLLAVALWLLWVVFTASVLAEILAGLRGVDVPRLRGLAPVQGLAAWLLSGLTAGVVATATLGPVAAAPTALTAPTAAVVLTTADSQHHTLTTDDPRATAASNATQAVGRSASTAPAASGAAAGSGVPRFALAASTGPLTITAGGQEYTVTVKRGDTLWHLADAWLGDPARWPEIYHLNADRYDDNGRMRGGEHIEARWTLVLPDDATPPAGATPPAPPPTVEPPAPAPTTPPSPTPPASNAPTPPAASTTPSPGQSRPPDDGVVVPPRQAPTGSPTGTPSASTAPSGGVQPAPDRRANPLGVQLPSGGWVDLGLAAAIVAAVALVWLHRRRRYISRPPSPDPRMDDPDLTPMPVVVRRISAGLRRPNPADTTPPNHTLDSHTRTDADDGPDDDVDDEMDIDGANAEPRPVTVAPPFVPALRNPSIEAWPPAGLGLTGAGAEAAARGFLTAALAAGGLDDPDARNWVITPATTIATLLGAAAVTVADTPRLTVTGTLTDALELLEEQTLHRTRLLYSHEVDTVDALRVADPDAEPLPPILLIADASALHERARIAALLTQGQRLDIHGVLLGAWPDGNTVVVDADGTTTPAAGDTVRHGHHPADVGRLTVLNPADTADLLGTLAESHTGRPQPPAPAEPAPRDTTPSAVETATAGGAAPGAEPGADPAPADDTADPTTAAPAVDAPTTVRATLSAAPAQSDNDDDDGAEDEADADPEQGDEPGADLAEPGSGIAEPGSGIAEVNLLGPPTIVGAAHGLPERKKSLELLVYLAAHNGSAAQQSIINDVLADAPRRRASTRLHTYVYDLHKALKSAAGQGTYIEHPKLLYVLNAEALDVDLWHLRDALAAAGTAADPGARVAALRRVV